MKPLKILFVLAATAVVAALAACNNDEPDEIKGEEYDDAYYASLASVSSSDSNFTANEDGGTIRFEAEGGSVAVTVDCGTEWTLENNATDIFTATVNGSDVTIVAGQNSVESEQTGTLTFYTASQHVKFATVTMTQNAYGAPTISVGTGEWHAPAVGALTTEITVESSLGDFDFERSADWLTVAKTDAGISLAADENEANESRTTDVTVMTTDGIRTASEVVTITQDGTVYLNVSIEAFNFNGGADRTAITVETNLDWDYESTDTWLSIERDGSDTYLAVAENDSSDSREGVVTITAGDGAENVTSAQIAVTQCGVRTFMLTYTTTSAGTNVTLPLAGDVDCTVNWGDGSDLETVTSANPSHTYASAGEYNVSIDGTVTTIACGATSTSTNNTLTAVRQWGRTGVTNMESAFAYCSALESIPTDNGRSFENLTTLYKAFYYCTSLKEIPAGLLDYSSNVTTCYCIFACTPVTTVPGKLFANCTSATDLSYAFYKCTSLTEVPEDLLYNCSGVTDFSYLLYGTAMTSIPAALFEGCTSGENFSYIFNSCKSLIAVPDGLFSKCAAATTFLSAFANCSNLETLGKYIFWGCSNVTTFKMTFYNCNVKSMGIGIFNGCSKVDSYEYTFYGNKYLQYLPEGLFDSSTEVTSFNYLFDDCTNLVEFPEGIFANNTKVETFKYLCLNCTALTSLPSDLFSNCTAATDFSYAFSGCTRLQTIGAGLFDSCTEVTTFGSVFSTCYSLTSIPENLFANNKKVTNFSYAFSYDTYLTGESAYDLLEIDGQQVKVHLYERSNYTDIYSTLKTTSYCFRGCTGLSDYYSIPSSWGGGGE